MNQTALFDTLPPATRTSDPGTSHQAEAEINNSGARARQTDQVANIVSRYPGRTCNELATVGELTERQLSKRLSDAHGAGLIKPGRARRCSVSGRSARTWEIKE